MQITVYKYELRNQSQPLSGTMIIVVLNILKNKAFLTNQKFMKSKEGNK